MIKVIFIFNVNFVDKSEKLLFTTIGFVIKIGAGVSDWACSSHTYDKGTADFQDQVRVIRKPLRCDSSRGNAETFFVFVLESSCREAQSAWAAAPIKTWSVQRTLLLIY